MTKSGKLTDVCYVVVGSAIARAGTRARGPAAPALAAFSAFALQMRGPPRLRRGGVADLAPHRGGSACGGTRLRGNILEKSFQKARCSYETPG
eukprot:9481616-Pyramimonas_sp.AAC.1